ncbi:CTL-like protein 2 [Copidosoma floridanum]|uniref:CTL-like protein 2 n=1 Tax=Copidosoma floridanum TaxID=29053 RepID=UPI000C6F8600|nr:CTL-like protein 2 [Copidosoma floridanum]
MNSTTEEIWTYHMGTVAYGSSPCVIIIVIFIMIKNLSNRMYEFRHNIFVMIVCWWYIFTRLFEVSIGVTAIHGQSFKKSADTVSQLYLRFPLRFFSVTKAFTWCAGVLSTVSSLVVIIACVVAFYSENMSNEKMIVALSTTLICIILVVLPIVIVLNAAVTSTFFCILEDFELDQEDKNRTCFMKASIKDLMLNSE